MKVLAVIPACAGSSTLPNRNIRIICGKPMICYAINNALESKYITDIVVTTNSSIILSIAQQMGVMTRQRDESLCNSWTSVDAVVYDVFNQLDQSDYDYVVTMQSISPALKTSTLDKAFEKIIDEKLDTLISVRNQAQFYWTEKDGAFMPMQKQRVNRHLLPPFYVETGAFMISKACCVKADSRLGERVGCYPLDGDEAIDVYSFGDLVQAEYAIQNRKVAIYTNGNDIIGLGHIFRVLQVADELFTKPDIYYDRAQTNSSVFGSSTHTFIPVDGESGFVNEISQKNYAVVINDVLNTSAEYMSALRKAAPRSKLINFEDEGTGACFADTVINALYEHSDDSRVRVGSQYYIIPKQFLVYKPIKIKETVTRVIVTFGGADPQAYTERILELALKPEYSGIKFYFILGKAKKNASEIATCAALRDNVCVLNDINNMPEMMCRCDAAISSRGRTCFELAALGVPTLSIAQHSREEKHSFICPENGFMCLQTAPDACKLEQAFNTLIFSGRAEREQQQEKMLAHDLRNGRNHIRDLLNEI